MNKEKAVVKSEYSYVSLGEALRDSLKPKSERMYEPIDFSGKSVFETMKEIRKTMEKQGGKK